ncbi:MAG: hypothetical protein U1E45_20005 [Geminicoccaceae bacterium]
MQDDIMKPRVFIHTNNRQMVGALLSAHSFRSRSRHADKFDVEIINHADQPFFARHDGQLYLRGGNKIPWRNDDLQSFTPLRFMPPEVMGYEGKALVVDPDVFAVGDVWELLSRDMAGKAIVCRVHTGVKRTVRGTYASSVMLLDCAKLRHWKAAEQFDALFDFTRDYTTWMGLGYEDSATIGEMETFWNDFDHLGPETRLLHNTRRMTQPWKTGLHVDFLPVERFPLFPPFGWLMRARRQLFGDYALLGKYKRHPDQRQEALFWALLRDTVEAGEIDEAFLRQEMAQGHLRADALEQLPRARTVDAVLADLEPRRAA